MSFISRKTELRQETRLLPELLQSIEILQMNSQELLEHLGRLVEENPVLEQDDVSNLYSSYEELRQQATWLDSRGPGTIFSDEKGEFFPEQWTIDRETESLAGFLRDQLDRKRLTKPLLALSKYLVELLDGDGRLDEEDLDELRGLKIPEPLLQQALETVQSLEPAGVGARSLGECLALQLTRQDKCSLVALEIVKQFLPELGRKQYGTILRKLGITTEELRKAEREITALEPHPGRVFEPVEQAAYVRPDVFIVELEGELKVVLNDFYLPKLSISAYYTKLLKDSDEKDTKAYLREKLQQARWVLDSLNRRKNTLQRCAEAILEAQRPFFLGKTGELSPMILSTISDTLELHPSTISRTIRNKYLQCRQGTYPLRYFFSRALGARGPSRQAVKQKILLLIKEENPRKPLSDQRLCELLTETGVRVARRTVAKYRMELGLGSAFARKQ